MQARTPARVVLITGASRGIGAEVATQFCAPDTHVVVNYRENAAHADAIADDIRRAGGSASTFAADISDESDAAALTDYIAASFGRLDTVILNTSGGPGVGTDAGEAIRLNRETQRRLTALALPLMPAGSRIVFVTSHQAHFYPHKAVPKGYAAIAAGHRAGETALYAMRALLRRAGVQLTVVSGDMVDTAPHDAGFATAVVNAANTPLPSSIVFVSSADYLLTA